jgi:hypothetical protein
MEQIVKDNRERVMKQVEADRIAYQVTKDNWTPAGSLKRLVARLVRVDVNKIFPAHKWSQHRS